MFAMPNQPTMISIVRILPFLLILPLRNFSQITTSNTMTPTQMVQNVLLGSGITVSNVSYTGYVNGISTFNATASTNLGFSSGVYLTTGSFLATDPLGFGGMDGPFGPSTNNQSVSQSMNPNGDPDLDVLLQQVGSTQTSNDAAVLEFDFIPQSDTVKFRYRFGSEEYNEYVPTAGGGFADVFGFFLTGISTPLPKTNIALLPGTTTPVSIYTVNNGNSFGQSTGPCLNCTYFVDNWNGIMDVAYDGMTTTLTAIYPVICGEKYHIKIVIGDAGDHAMDSGVFLEAGSFTTGAPLVISSFVHGNTTDSVLVEGCDSARMVFVRPANTVATAQSFNYTLSGTATNGTDYTNLNGLVNFPVGVDSVVLTLHAFTDGLTEGLESIIMTVSGVTICGQVHQLSFHLYIDDASNVNFDIPDTVICPGQQLVLTTNPSGGGPYTYLWNTGATTASITVSPNANTNYWCTISGSCGSAPHTDTVHVTVYTYSQLTITSDVLFSSNDLQFKEGCDSLYFIFNRGNANITTTETFTIGISGSATNGVDYNSIPSTITFNPGQTTFTIRVKASDDVTNEGLESITVTIPGNACNPATQSIDVKIIDTPPLQVAASNNVTLSCPGQSTTLTSSASGGIPSYTYSWSPGTSTNTSFTVNPLVTTVYIVTAHDSSCVNHTATATVTVTVPVVQPMQTVVSGTSIRCPGQTASLNATVTGGYTPYTYLWSTTATSPGIVVSPTGTATYTVVVTDACNVYNDTVNYTVIVTPYIPLHLTASNDTTICPKTMATLTGTASNGVAPYTYNWGSSIHTAMNTVSPGFTTMYHVQVTDSCGLSVFDSVRVIVPIVDAEYTYEYIDDHNVQFTNNSLGINLVYTWYFGDGTAALGEVNPLHGYPAQQIYFAQLIAETPEGCKDSITHPIIPPMEVWIPNAFTPNKDLLNPSFMAYGLGVSEFKMTIYDRWGLKIFESDDMNKGWDGTFKGNACQEDVYVYKVSAIGVDPLKKLHKAGQVSLVR